MSHVLKVSEAASLAMHAAVMLAANSDRPTSNAEAAAVLGVSEAHLSKVLQRLAHAGLVKALRGPRGGFALARPAGRVTLLQVYEAIEGKLTPPSCLLGKRVCDGRNCILGSLLDSTNRMVREYLARTRLSDLTSVYRR